MVYLDTYGMWIRGTKRRSLSNIQGKQRGASSRNTYGLGMVAEHTVIPTLEKLRQEDFFRFHAFWDHNPENLPQNNPLGCFDLTVDQPPVHVPPAVTLAQNLKFTGVTSELGGGGGPGIKGDLISWRKSLVLFLCREWKD